MSVSHDQIKTKLIALTKSQEQDPVIVNRCFEIATTFGLSVEDLGNRWEAYVINKQLPTTMPTMKELQKFSDEVQAQQQNQARPPETPKKKFQIEQLSTDIFSDFGVQLPAVEMFNNFKQEASKTPDKPKIIVPSPTQSKPSSTPIANNNTPTKPPATPTSILKKPPALSPKAPATPAPKTDEFDDPEFDAAAAMQLDVQSTPSSQGTRSNSGKVEISFQGALTSGTSSTSNGTSAPSRSTPVELTVLTRVPPYRYMFDRLESKSQKLDARVERLGTEALRVAGLERNGVLERASQDSIHVVGRICAENSEGRLHPTATVLADCSMDGPKPRVLLELRDLDAYSVFPGQAVAVTGTNPTGKKLVVKQVHQPPPPAPSSFVDDHTNSSSQQNHSSSNGTSSSSSSSQKASTGLTLLIAGGPFSYHENLKYEAFADLVKVAIETKPDVVLLLGPFVDAEHPHVKGNRLEEPFEEFFEERVLSDVISYLQPLLSRSTRLVIVPSLRDVHHSYVFPQPPFAITVKQEKVTFTSNPSLLRVDGVVLAVLSSPDVLQHLAAEEICKLPAPQTPSGSALAYDRIAQLCEHIIRQQSFYPLNPPAIGVNLDSAHLSATELSELPDILVFKSEMKPFVKVVCGVLCINTGPLTRNNSNGFYTQLRIHPSSASSRNVHERTRVDIIKI